jgi:hypothetical protein
MTTNLHFTFLADLMKKSKMKVVEHITEELMETKKILENQMSGIKKPLELNK